VVSALGEREVIARKGAGEEMPMGNGWDLRPTPLMAGEGVNGDSRGGIKAGE
jgi:hypothetical protein